MSGRSITLLILLGAIGLGIACLWIQWYILWAIPILLVIGWVSEVWNCEFWKAALGIVVFGACIGILWFLIAFCGWHTCWIVPIIFFMFWELWSWVADSFYRTEERKAEEKRKEEERLAEEKRKEGEREQQREHKRSIAQKISQANETLETYGNFFDKIFARRILFDSNIWMNGDYDVLFTESFISIKKMHSQIMMPGIQFDEIENLKNSPDESKKYAARCALKRIELAQQKGILALHGVGVDAKRYAYADPEFIKYLLFEAAQLPECSGSVFVTDDRALRIRVKAVVKERLGKEVLVLSGEEIFELANMIASARAVIELYNNR